MVSTLDLYQEGPQIYDFPQSVQPLTLTLIFIESAVVYTYNLQCWTFDFQVFFGLYLYLSSLHLLYYTTLFPTFLFCNYTCLLCFIVFIITPFHHPFPFCFFWHFQVLPSFWLYVYDTVRGYFSNSVIWVYTCEILF